MDVIPSSRLTSSKPSGDEGSAKTVNYSHYDMTDKVIAVTGGAQGIGLATVKLLLARGAKVSIGDLDDQALNSARDELEMTFGKDRTRVFKLNVADKDEVENWIKETVKFGGGLDGAANIAGINGPDTGKVTLAQTSDEHWNAVVSVNLTGMFYCVRAELNNMSGKGSIVCTTSVQGLIGFPMTAAYSITKHGIVGMVKATAKEVGEMGIRVNAIAPGAIDTQMVSPKDRENIQTPIKRLGKPEECAHLIAFLLSDEASFITGATYSIDGGWAC